MISNVEINQLKKITENFTGLEFTQGTGSNISVKSGDYMVIKASGYTLSDIISKDGFVELNYINLRDGYLNETVKSQKTCSGIVNLGTCDKYLSNGIKPSIETGFHSFLKKYVVHIHPMYLNLLLCLNESDDILKELYSEFNYVVVDYFKPGHDLCVSVLKQYNNFDGVCDVIFLKNHGLIVTNDNLDRVVSLVSEVCEIAKSYVLKTLNFEPEYVGITANGGELIGSGVCAIRRFVFPDAILFLHDILDYSCDSYSILNGCVVYNLDNKLLNSYVDEVLFVHNFILENADKFGTLNYLDELQVSNILDMDEEKYRKSLLLGKKEIL